MICSIYSIEEKKKSNFLTQNNYYFVSQNIFDVQILVVIEIVNDLFMIVKADSLE